MLHIVVLHLTKLYNLSALRSVLSDGGKALFFKVASHFETKPSLVVWTLSVDPADVRTQAVRDAEFSSSFVGVSLSLKSRLRVQ